MRSILQNVKFYSIISLGTMEIGSALAEGWDRERGVGLGMECCATENLLLLAVDKP